MTIDWIAEHWEVCSVIGALILRELTKNMAKTMAKQTAEKMIEHFLSPQERMIRDIKRNMQIMMDHMGIEGQWSGDGPIFGHKARRSLMRLLTGFSRVILRRTLRWRRRKRMQVKYNKFWVAGAITFAISTVVKAYGPRWGIQPHEGWEASIYPHVLDAVQYGSVAFVAWINKHHIFKNPVTIQEQSAPTPRNYTDMVPVMNEVHKGVNKLYEDLKTGKVNESTQDAINAYLRIQAILKEKGEQDAGTKAG